MAENSKQAISSFQQFKHETLDIFLNADRAIQLFTHNLDPRVLNNREIEKALIDFVKKSRASKLQILIYQEELMRGTDHRLVSLAQQFTSTIQIRIVPRDYHENLFGFYIVDNRTMIYRSNVERYEAEKLRMPDFFIKEKSKLFETTWQSSSPASFLRALYL
ncbi:MAG: hypothetical protein L3J46_07755 [Kangiellaceae bacterium]|nr:hypothetical protein [Kangiellaceae bacterium]